MENLIELKEELAWRSEQAKEIFDRENHPDGNKMLKNQNFGEYVAYSHCLRRLNQLESVWKKQQNRMEALNLHGVSNSEAVVCPKCGSKNIQIEYFDALCPDCNTYFWAK